MLSAFERRNVLRALFRNTAPPFPPAVLHVALFLAMPDEHGNGGEEVIGAGYGRVPVTTGSPGIGAGGGWSEPTEGGEVTNTAEIKFAKASAGWGSIAGAGLFDGAGIMRALAPADERIEIARNDAYVIEPGGLRFRFTGGGQ